MKDKKIENGRGEERWRAGSTGEQGTAGIPKGGREQKSRHCVSCERHRTH